MKLIEYLKKNDFTAARFSRKVGLSGMKITQIIRNDDLDMYLSTALRIQKATDNQVTVQELIKDELWNKPKKKYKTKSKKLMS